jgi:hypothetical protein
MDLGGSAHHTLMPSISDKSLGYLVVCKLTDGADYSGMHKGLARFHHRLIFPGVWMIRTKEAAAEIHRWIYKRVQPEDQILIFEITDQGVWSGAIPVETSQFIKDVCLAIAPQSYTDVLEARRTRQTLGKDTDAA